MSLLLLDDVGVCCCRLSFIASLSAELAFCDFLFGLCVLFCVVFHVVGEVLFGAFVGLDFGLCS